MHKKAVAGATAWDINSYTEVFMKQKGRTWKVIGMILAVAFSATMVLPVIAGCSSEVDECYTYNEYISLFPTSWSTHNASSDTDTYVQQYTEIGLYDMTLSEDKSTYAFSDEMATGDPVNVTAEYAGKYGIDSTVDTTASEGKAWEITLNPDATWENGEAIMAEDYVWSMERVLSPDMKNELASTYITGDYEIYNAQGYYNSTDINEVYTKIAQDAVYTDDEIDEFIEDGILYFSFETGVYDAEGAVSISYYYSRYPARFTVSESYPYEYLDVDTDVYAYLYDKYIEDANEYGYIQITTDNKEDFELYWGYMGYSILKSYIPYWYNSCSLLSYEEAEDVDFFDVGIFTTGDYKFVIVFANDLSQWSVKYLLTSNWIVYQEYYEAGYSTQGSLQVTTYGTTSGDYMGYGPYTLSSYQTDKELIFERNENWYGYDETKTNYHADQYQTDKIVTAVISEQATALLEFESGNLDYVKLTSNDMDNYKFSDYLLTRTASNSWSLSFNSDPDALESIESDGAGNRQILASTSFRKGLSLCLNRSYIGSNIMVGSASAYSFINSNYYYDIENDEDSIYRNTDQAKNAILKLYGISYGDNERYSTLDETYEAVTGYDIDSATECFEEAYKEAVSEGWYTDGESIQINIYYNSTTAAFTSLCSYIQTQVTAATEGTDLEGKITITAKSMETGRSTAISQGTIECTYYSYSGDYTDPNGMLGAYTDSDNNTIVEYGFDPKTETFDITYDFDGDGTEETVTDTYYNWQKSIAAGGTYASASNDVKLAIMSELEYNLLAGFRTIPICVGTDVALYSKKVNFGTTDANIFCSYGGVRLITYNYNNSEWTEFCKTSSNLDYT